MTIIFDEQQRALRDSVRQFFGEQFSSEHTRRLMSTTEGYEPKTWLRMANELGLQGIALAEKFDGAGATAIEQLVLFEEMGRALVGTPFFSTVALAANALIVSGDEEAQRRVLPRIADGSLIATVAGLDAAGPSSLTATETSSGYVLDGEAGSVTDGHLADVIIVAARYDTGTALFLVDTTATGFAATALDTLDATRKHARLGFDRTPAVALGSPEDCDRTLSRTVDLARIALAAEQLGGAQRCLDTAVEYAKIRTQFGRKIGSFQAVKHMCADMLIAVESARAAVYHATELSATAAAEQDPTELSLAASMAKALASQAYTFCARQNIQIHGGIGCTWEHDAHLHYRRAHYTASLLGTVDEQLNAIADRLAL